MSDIRSFVFTILLDGGADRTPYKTLKDAKATISEWKKEGIEYPKGMDARDFMYIWNHTIGTEQDHTPSDLEVRANGNSVPFHKTLDTIDSEFLSDHVIPYRDHVLVVFYRYNHKNHGSDWCCAVYSFDTDDHSGDGMCTLRQLLMQSFDDPGCAMKVAIQIADNKNY